MVSLPMCMMINTNSVITLTAITLDTSNHFSHRVLSLLLADESIKVSDSGSGGKKSSF